MYLYEGHLGTLYLSDRRIPFDDLYCDQCGDFDFCLGEVKTYDDVLELVEEQEWDAEMLEEFKKKLEEVE